MIVKSEMSLARDFTFWAGAAPRFMAMTTPQVSAVEEVLEEMYPDGMTDTQINDVFWFEPDFLAECNGFESWEEMMYFNCEV